MLATVDYWMDRPMPLPNTVAMPGRAVLHVECKDCGHDAALEESALGKREWSPETKARLRCRECGSRRVDARMVWEHGAPPHNVIRLGKPKFRESRTK